MPKHLSKLPTNFKRLCYHPWLDMQAALAPDNTWSLFLDGQEIDAEDWFEVNAIQAIVNFMGFTAQHQRILIVRIQEHLLNEQMQIAKTAYYRSNQDGH